MPRKLTKERKYHFIYKTTCNVTGKYYIGMHSTDDLEDTYLGSGKRLSYSIRKYGAENHIREILEHCSSREELASRESEIVNLNGIAKEECMNIRLGGWGGWNDYNSQQAQRLKNDKEYRLRFSNSMSNSNKLKPRGFVTDRTKSCNWSGKKHTEETRLKMSVADRTGNKNSQYGTCWITNNKENKKIKKDELETWTSKGWKRGRKIRY